MADTILRLPANYQDPDPKHFGWGHEQFTDSLLVEERDANVSEVACSVSQAKAANPMAEAIEKSLREEMPFDAGWSMLPAEKRVYGRTLMVSQNMGNCVGNSHCALLASRIAHEVLVEGDREEPLGAGNLSMPFIPYSYAVGRHMAGIRGRGDGSTCQGQIKGTLEYGFLPCFTPGLENYSGTLPQCSERVGRDFGLSDREFRAWSHHAKKFELQETPIIGDAGDVWTTIVEKRIPLQIASSRGFRYWQYDQRTGVHLYRFGGTWHHSMQLVAAFEINGSRFVAIRNQWGEAAHVGSPDVGIPGGCMVITLELMDQWLRIAHCVGIGEIKGVSSDWGF